MATFFSTSALAALDGKIYAVGGVNDEDNTLLSSVEAFDPQTNAWTAVAPLGTARYSLGLAVLQGKLYAVGGELVPGHKLATVEAFDPKQNRWDEVAPLPAARSALALAAL